MQKANVTVMVPGFAMNLFLLSPVMHWAVLINTNAWYGCEELKSRSRGRVVNATNFVSRRAYIQVTFWCEQKGTTLHSLDRSDLSDCQSENLRSLATPGFREISKS